MVEYFTPQPQPAEGNQTLFEPEPLTSLKAKELVPSPSQELLNNNARSSHLKFVSGEIRDKGKLMQRFSQHCTTWLTAASVSLLLFNGCSTIGDVPPALRVNLGEHPGNQDEQVRFRTTYYFRIVDSCKIEEGRSLDSTKSEDGNYRTSLTAFNVRTAGKLKIVSDSLYRFRMTGKASALFAKIHFESGVLRTEQIDPFGSQVSFDKDTNSFRITPANTVRETTRRDDAYKEISRLKKLRSELTQEGQETQDLIATLIKNQIRLLGNENDPAPQASTLAQSNAPQSSGELLCLDGRPTKRSYFLYGPEGVRRLDPDERLLMAMSSDSKPLIGMLQQLAGKSLQSKQPQESDLKEIVDERARILTAQQQIESLPINTPEDLKTLIDKLETIFESKP